MNGEGRIAESEGAELQGWEAETLLSSVGVNEARFSRGFLCADPSAWFVGLREHWLPLAHQLGTTIEFVGYNQSFALPADLPRLVQIEVERETSVIGMTLETEQTLASAVVPSSDQTAAGVIVEYLERRLITTLSRSWAGANPLQLNYIGSLSPEAEANSPEIAGVLSLQLKVGGLDAELHFGLGPKLLSILDTSWRAELVHRYRASGADPLSDQIHTASIELAQLAVPPAMLIDYMRGGTVIDLEKQVSSEVRIRVDGQIWGEGELKRLADSFAVEVTNLNPGVSKLPDGTTGLQVEIGRVELDQEALLEHAQIGAILITDSKLHAPVSLIVSGEYVASAMLGILGSNFALGVLPK